MQLLYIHIFPVTTNQANIIQVLQMCHAFQQNGAEVTLALPESSTASNQMSLVINHFGIPAEFKIITYPKYTLIGRLESLGTFWGINKLMQEFKEVDCCYVRDAFLAKMAIKRGLNTIYEQHNVDLHPNPVLNWLYLKMFRRYACSEKLLNIVAISNALADKLIENGVIEDKIMVFHDGVNVDDYAKPRSRTQARAELKLATKKKMALYVGSLYADRGIDNIIKLAKMFSECEFVVVGGPDQRKLYWKSESKKQGLTNISFIGRVAHSQVKSYLFAADILLMLWSRNVPTIDVCSPLKLFEYMASGRIIVGHGFSTIKEVLKDGETAILTNPDSYADLEKKVRYALTLDYPNKIAENARHLALTEYSWNKRAQSILSALPAATLHPACS